MNGPEHVIELFHGYTYSRASACVRAPGLATLDVYRDEGLFERAKLLEPRWADAVFSAWRDPPGVMDIRQVGLTAAVDLEPRADGIGKRGFDCMERAFHDEGLMVRTAADTVVVTPPLIISEQQIDELTAKVANVVRASANQQR